MTADSRQHRAPALPLTPALDLLTHVWMLNHSLERLSSRMDRELGITAQQRVILLCVGKFPGISAGQIASVFHLDAGTVSAALRRLEAKGLLERRKDGRDKRRVNLGLTAKGRALDRPMDNTVERGVEALLASTSAAELAATKEVLRRLTSLLLAKAEQA
jgi:DNA-binding MarR family transcriptional regulator